jgi:hypothetical protein
MLAHVSNGEMGKLRASRLIVTEPGVGFRLVRDDLWYHSG